MVSVRSRWARPLASELVPTRPSLARTRAPPGSDAASTGSEAEASAQTAHGLVRAADPSRLDAGAQRDVTAKATETFTQRDGADVYVQEVGGKYNVVIKGSKSVITNLKTINASKLAKLARKYGWVPK